VVTIVVDHPDRIARSFEIVDEITHERGLVTSEMVPALAASHDAGRRRKPASLPSRFCAPDSNRAWANSERAAKMAPAPRRSKVMGAWKSARSQAIQRSG
jgi:hypothetical protein